MLRLGTVVLTAALALPPLAFADSAVLLPDPTLRFFGRPLGLVGTLSSSSSSPRPEASISASLLSGMSKALGSLVMGRARRRGRRFCSVAVESGIGGREAGFDEACAGVGGREVL